MNNMPDKDTMQRYMKQAMKMYKSYSDGRPAAKTAENIPVTERDVIPDERKYPEANEDIPTDDIPENEGAEGKLIVYVSSVRGLYPVAGAKVTVFTGSFESPVTVSEMISDGSGKAEFTLSAPPKYLSESPGSDERVYALYNVSVRREGYLNQVNTDVAVFADTSTVLNAVLTADYAAESPGDTIVNGEECTYDHL